MKMPHDDHDNDAMMSPEPGCTDDIFTSDHSPVFGTFQVGVSSLPGSKTGELIGLAPMKIQPFTKIQK